MSQQMRPSLNTILGALLLSFIAIAAPQKSVPRPQAREFQELVGSPLQRGFERVVWSAGVPQQTNLWLFAVQVPDYDPARLRTIADFFGVKGDILPMASDMVEAPGYWIKEATPTNVPFWRSVYFSLRTGEIGYGGGDTGSRWDRVNHRPLGTEVPEQAELLAKALALLPALGLTTNDLQHQPDGKLWYAFRDSTTGYTDNETKQRKKYVHKRSVVLLQSIPGGGKTYSMGGGGALDISFVGGGKVAGIEMMFRRPETVGEAHPMSLPEIEKALLQGRAYTHLASLPSSFLVTNCTVVYPQGNGSFRQAYLWPFYQIDGRSIKESETKPLRVFIPLQW